MFSSRHSPDKIQVDWSFMQTLELTVIGAGYVGLSTALALAMAGHRVHVYERNLERLEALQRQQIPFAEPLLETVLHSLQDRIFFTADLGLAVQASSIVMIAVGTPPTPAQGVDLSQVFDAVQQLAPFLNQIPRVIVLKSTVPVGTSEEITATLVNLAPDSVFSVASNPEFLRQGRALRDAVFPDRIVFGTNQTWALEQLEILYAPIIHSTLAVPPELEPFRPMQPIPVLQISNASSELAKYAANAFLAMKISFINEIANVCDATSADIDEIVSVLAEDKRIGKDFLQAGLGYGGSCFPKDTRALNQLASRSGYEFRLLRAVIEVNNQQRFRALERLEQVLNGFRGRRIAVLGLSFKPETDDLRESIGLEIALELMARGAKVIAHDPMLEQMKITTVPNNPSLEVCLTNADAAILVTEWSEYKTANWAVLGQTMKQRIILDGRNALVKNSMLEAGFLYLAIGRSQSLTSP